MSTTESPWNAESPPPKSSNRKLWIFGCAGAAILALLAVGILATVFIPHWMRRFPAAQRGKINADLGMIDAAMEQYKARHGAYPRSLDDLVAPGEALSSSGLPHDPWDHDYVMLAGADPQKRPRLLTYGRDGVLGGAGPDMDIVYNPR
jgi:general secretion pathway protein G